MQTIEMAQWLKTCTTFTEDPSLILSIYVGQLITIYNPSSKGSDVLVFLDICIQSCTYFHVVIHIIKSKINI